MAPFNAHFAVAEKLWPQLDGPWKSHYGQFCFGCVAPDVEKSSASLTQKETHFFDQTTDYELMVTHRSVAFINAQAEFLRQPFDELPPPEQAFALGYLCHLCVDEVSKDMWREETWHKFQQANIGWGAFSALDNWITAYIQDFDSLNRAVCRLQPLNIIPLIPLEDLRYFHKYICESRQAQSLVEKYQSLVKLVHSIKPADRQGLIDTILSELPVAEKLLHHFDVDKFLKASLHHSLSRLNSLIEGRRPMPGPPEN